MVVSNAGELLFQDLREVKADAEPQKMDWEARAEQSPDVGEARSKRQAEEDAIILYACHLSHLYVLDIRCTYCGRLRWRFDPVER